jgi:hypothetical protein
MVAQQRNKLHDSVKSESWWLDGSQDNIIIKTAIPVTRWLSRDLSFLNSHCEATYFTLVAFQSPFVSHCVNPYSSAVASNLAGFGSQVPGDEVDRRPIWP